MIKTTTYIDTVNVKRDLLSAFSAVDYSNTETMSEQVLSENFRRLLSRLGALVVLHGPKVPRDMIRSLRDAEPSQAFALVTGYVEAGSNDHAETASRELQQELVHFSRIVDLEFVSEFSSRRLQHAQRIPDSLKVLVELITVARSRMLQRGFVLPTPERGVTSQITDDLSEQLTVQHRKDQTDYLLVIKGDRRRQRRSTAFLFEELLAYLTPVEALWAMAAYFIEPGEVPAVAVELAAYSGDAFHVFAWRPAERSDADDYDLVLACLPDVTDESKLASFISAPSTCPSSSTTISVNPGSGAHAYKLSRPQAKGEVNVARLAAAGLNVAKERLTEDVVSIEFGHIHLDRNLDVDQEVGTVMGKGLVAWCRDRQAVAPVNALMLDDDHVLINLRPREYIEYIRSHLDGSQDFIVIPESSPIVRAIVVAMFVRLKTSPLAATLTKHGDNLYVTLGNGSVVELFEDFDGTCGTGCIFFESALLIYRSFHQDLTEAFLQLAAIDVDPHVSILETLDGDEDHDAKRDKIARSAERFGHLLNPHEPHAIFCKTVESLIASTSEPLLHINVLEDYYGVQQDKVRQLLADLQLPLSLATLHFNVQTEAVFWKP